MTDPTMDLGQRVLRMLADGYDGQQILRLGVTVEEAEQALHAYAARILHGTTPPMANPECGSGGYDGWCYVHGLFHPAASA